MLLFANQHGTKPRFEIQPITWYRGGDDVCFTKAFECFIKKGPKEGASCHTLKIQGRASLTTMLTCC